jgi:ABC-type nitrate/sulfonate/bicarbonate transport system permease component
MKNTTQIVQPEPSENTTRQNTPGKAQGGVIGHWLYGGSTIVFLVIAWYLAARYEMINRTLMPSPSEVWYAFVELSGNGELVEHVNASMYRIIAGLILGFVTAVPMGLLIARNRWVKAFLEPLIEIIRPIPALAFLPLAILWFGIGEPSKLFIMWFGTFFVIIVSVIEGVYNFDIVYIKVAKNLNASERQIFYHVLLPGILPFILEGNRQAVATAFRVVVSAEMIAAQTGLGFLIMNSAIFYQTDRVIVGIIVLAVLGMLCDRFLIILTRKVFLKYKAEPGEIAV